MSFSKDQDRKKEEFTNYINQHGVLDRLTEVFTMLFYMKEPPVDPINFTRINLCPDNETVRGVTEMESKLADAKNELKRLQKVQDELKTYLNRLEGERTLSYEDCVEVDDTGEERLTISATDPEMK